LKRRIPQSVFACAVLATLSGCASIISGRHAEVAFDSHPANAHVVVRDNAGREVAELNTPGVVSLKRNRRLFMPARYTATYNLPGHHPAEVPLYSTLNPWLVGNVVVGGIPGLIVDTATGAAWKPRLSTVHQNLSPYYQPQAASERLSGPADYSNSLSPVSFVADESSPPAEDQR
jgi:hypothetical protein